jgi:hypothetical protein
MAQTRKPKRHHIQMARKAYVRVNTSRNTNQLHIEINLTADQERRLLKLLEKRNKSKS